jgi:integral membrane sensor domain MASE1
MTATVRRRRSGLSGALRLLAVAAAYYATAWIGLSQELVGGQVTPLWPPTGVALASLFTLSAAPAAYRTWSVWRVVCSPSPRLAWVLARTPCRIARSAGGRAFVPVGQPEDP